jgi:hypothetical protein
MRSNVRRYSTMDRSHLLLSGSYFPTTTVPKEIL